MPWQDPWKGWSGDDVVVVSGRRGGRTRVRSNLRIFVLAHDGVVVARCLRGRAKSKPGRPGNDDTWIIRAASRAGKRLLDLTSHDTRCASRCLMVVLRLLASGSACATRRSSQKQPPGAKRAAEGRGGVVNTLLPTLEPSMTRTRAIRFPLCRPAPRELGEDECIEDGTHAALDESFPFLPLPEDWEGQLGGPAAVHSLPSLFSRVEEAVECVAQLRRSREDLARAQNQLESLVDQVLRRQSQVPAAAWGQFPGPTLSGHLMGLACADQRPSRGAHEGAASPQ